MINQDGGADAGRYHMPWESSTRMDVGKGKQAVETAGPHGTPAAYVAREPRLRAGIFVSQPPILH